MSLPKRYKPQDIEPQLQEFWQAAGIYHYQPEDDRAVYSIDTPPPTVSGKLHLGHVYSYTHPDLIARFRRMRGENVFYPMGFDDNGLPTERLVEKRLGKTARQIGRSAFTRKCLEISTAAEKDYQTLWQRLGLSIDWRYSYRTIDEHSRRTSQRSFIELFKAGLVYHQEAPAIWCPECQTAIAQAELDDLERQSEFVTLSFHLDNGETLPVATTRPELLPACVTIFVHPADPRYTHLEGQYAQVPLFAQRVPILADPNADPQKGTGAVMCCTFGDTTDVAWWRQHNLPLISAIDQQGLMTNAAGEYQGLALKAARERIKQDLEARQLILMREEINQSVRVHERCDTPVEYVLAKQWFIAALKFKEQLLAAGDRINWHPPHMKSRYQTWVENLSWDWCISRQRYFGVPFPLWYCRECGEVILAEIADLPIDPTESKPQQACKCGSHNFIPEKDVLDTWATSSLTPQIVGRWLGDDGSPDRDNLYKQVFPFSLRPQAHEIIRTWAFYTILKSHFHFNQLPWKDVLISGWGIAGEGMGKISKSRGGGPLPPLEMIQRYSADAVRYWATSTSPGKDAVISEEKIQVGTKFVNKLWNVARFSQRFLVGYHPPTTIPPLTTADRWILASLQRLIRRVTQLLEKYEYASAKSEIESFFWVELADNYLEMAKQRLYTPLNPRRDGAIYALYKVLLTLIKLCAPYLPHVTEAIYQGIFTSQGEIIPAFNPNSSESANSIHTTNWPQPEPIWENADALAGGEILKAIASAVRRYKSERNLSLASELPGLQIVFSPENYPGEEAETLKQMIVAANDDIRSVSRAHNFELVTEPNPGWIMLPITSLVNVLIQPVSLDR